MRRCGRRRQPAHAERRMSDMAMNLGDFLAEHTVSRENVEAHKKRMLAEVRAFRLRELRELRG